MVILILILLLPALVGAFAVRVGIGATLGVFGGRLIADQVRQALPKNVSQ